MKIINILNIVEEKNVSIVIHHEHNSEIETISLDSRESQINGLFFAIPGFNQDGTQFIEDAIQKGALCIMCEKIPDKQHEHVCYIVVAKIKQIIGYVAHAFYGKPSEYIKVIGVTGTNGKTSVSRIISQSLRMLGMNAGSIGTLGFEIGGEYVEIPNTTPDAISLNRMLKQMVDSNVEICAMEVSSIGIEEGRVNGIKFSMAVFTNLTQDHLDYHKTMKAYETSKLKLISMVKEDGAVILNLDGGFDMTKISTRNLITFGVNKHAFVKYKTISDLPVAFQIDNQVYSVPNFIGRFNSENCLAALCVLRKLGIPATEIQRVFLQITPPKGRMERVVCTRNVFAFVDYAHTPDALDKVLKTLFEIKKTHKLICVFGCGGDRDVLKRPLMGNVAEKYSDVIFITDDNPRTEKSHKITSDIANGIRKKTFEIIHDRKSAIENAIHCAKEGDIVLVAGKGHEEYQIVGNTKFHFSDQEVISGYNDF